MLQYSRTRNYPSGSSAPEGYPRPMLYQQYSQGDYIRACGIALGALALNGYDDRTAGSLDYDTAHPSYGFTDRMLHFSLGIFYNEVLRVNTSSSGYYREGTAYFAMAEDRDGALFYNAFWHTGYNLFSIWPLTAEMHLFTIKSRLPNGWMAPENDNTVTNSLFAGHIQYTQMYDNPEDQSASSWAMHTLPFTLESGGLFSYLSSTMVASLLFTDTEENRNIPCTVPAWDPTQFLEDYLVLRTDWTKDSAYLMLSAKHWPTGSVSHDENDQNSFLMYAKNAYLAVDPGYGQGSSAITESVIKPWCRGSKYAHNMVLVDGYLPGQRADVPTSTYTYGNSFFPENTFTTSFMDFAESKMTDWEFQADSRRNVITERRSVLFPRGSDYFILIDDMQSQLDNTHDFSFILQGNSRHPFKDTAHPGDFVYQPASVEAVPLADNLTLTETGGGKTGEWLIENCEGKDVRFRGFFAAPGPERLTLAPSDGWLGYVNYYAARNRFLEAKISRQRNTRYLVILYPDFVDEISDDAIIERLSGEQLAGNRTDQGGARITLRDGRVDRVAVQGVGNAGECLTVDGSMRGDGEIIFCRNRKDKTLESCFLTRGTTLSFDDFSTPLVSSLSPLRVVSLHFGESLKITGYVSGGDIYELKVKTTAAPQSVIYGGENMPFTFDKQTGICAFNLSGAGDLEITLSPSTGVHDPAADGPLKFALGPNYPNPFNPSTLIPFVITGSGEQEVEIIIYNLSGQKIRTLLHERKTSGQYTVRWDSCDDRGFPVSSGIYLAQLKAYNRLKTLKMSYLK
jgi:hypothetical protein